MSQITILYFGRTRHILGKSSQKVSLAPQLATLTKLKEWLRAKSPRYAEALSAANKIQMALNGNLTHNAKLKAGDEVAFFPPASGG